MPKGLGGYQPDTRTSSSRRADFDLQRRIAKIEAGGGGGGPGPAGPQGPPGSPGATGPPGASYRTLVGGAASVVVAHNLNNQDVNVEVYRAAAPYDTIDCTVEHTDLNNVTLRFLSTPAANAYVCNVILGSPGSGSGGGGTIILNGHGPPSAAIGEDGNYYLDVDSDILYGPKAAAGFGASRTLQTGPPTQPAGQSYEMGETFEMRTNGQIVAARFYRHSGSSYTSRALRLYNPVNQALIAQTATTTEGSTFQGWVQAAFATPISYAANQRFIISYAENTICLYESGIGTSADPASATIIEGRYGSPLVDFPENSGAFNFYTDLVVQPVTGEVWPVAMAPGAGGVASYVHNQAVAAATWLIDHNLGFHPNVTVVDSSGDQVEGTVTYVTLNQVRVMFSAAFAGIAYLS